MQQILQNISLKPYNTFHIEAKASYFVEVFSVEELQEILQDSAYKDMKKLVLWGGSNMLFTTDFDGLVIKMSIGGIGILEQDYDTALVKAMAWENWSEFVQWCVENDCGGVENLAGIPGTVGAAPVQNIGAYGVEVKDVIQSVEAVDVTTGKIRTFSSQECRFWYRDSFFKQAGRGKYIITAVTFALWNQMDYSPEKLVLEYGAIQETLKKRGISKPKIQDIHDVIVSIRASKLPNPDEIGNAGSFFKNPTVSLEKFTLLQKDFPTIVGYPLDNGFVKLAAGWLIEQSGWKGKRIGNAGVHEQQALVLVNHGSASGADILNLAWQIQSDVRQKFGVSLEMEVNSL